MITSLHVALHYTADHPCDMLLQIEPAIDATQTCLHQRLTLPQGSQTHVITGQDGIGTRRWITQSQGLICQYQASFDINRPGVDFSALRATPLPQTPAEVIPYLMPSRYCHPEAAFDLLATQFRGLTGGALIAAAATMIQSTFTYDITASHAGTTATDSLVARAGVCRDYAHVLITLARAAGLPARYVSAYSPGVTPQDFHAVAEVYLDGAWHLVDPTGMARPQDILRIGVGRDAACVSFLTSYGFLTLKKQTVSLY